MEIYITPDIDIIEILVESNILAGSTGEPFEDLEDYGGSWS